MSKSYEAFVAEPEHIPERVEIRLFIRDLTPGPRKYDRHFVEARVSSSEGLAPNGDTLVLRYLDGKPYPKVFAIEVVRDMEDFLIAQPYAFHTGLF